MHDTVSNMLASGHRWVHVRPPVDIKSMAQTLPDAKTSNPNQHIHASRIYACTIKRPRIITHASSHTHAPHTHAQQMHTTQMYTPHMRTCQHHVQHGQP